MYTPMQLEAIKLFGRKDLTEGCIIYCPTYEWDKYIFINEKNIKDATSSEYGIYLQWRYARMTYQYEIIGHEVHLEDLFRVAEERGWKTEILNAESIWYKYCIIIEWKWIEYIRTLPLLDQPNLSDIISLFK